MPYVCLDCGEVYNEEFERCPKSSCCNWTGVREIDELMIPIVVRLNELGYETDACCSGHAYNHSEPYISFYTFFFRNKIQNCVVEEAFKNLPHGWRIDGFYIRYDFPKIYDCTDTNESTSKYYEIMKAHMLLLHYVNKELKPLNDYLNTSFNNGGG